MLAGQYVEHDGATWQVSRIIGGAIGYTGPSSVLYELVPIGGGVAKYLRDPKGKDLELAPACTACRRPAGFAACSATGEHQGPLPAPEPRKPLPAQPRGCCPSREVAARRLCGCGGVPEPWGR